MNLTSKNYSLEYTHYSELMLCLFNNFFEFTYLGKEKLYTLIHHSNNQIPYEVGLA